MKSYTGVTCLLWLLVGASAMQPWSYQAANTYVYEAESTILAGIPELKDQYSGFSMVYKLEWNVHSPEKAILKISEVRTGKINDELPGSYQEDVDFHHTASPAYERELSKPIIVTFKDGLVEEFEALQSDPEWSVNIKKGILTNFQLDLAKVNRPVAVAGNQVPKIDPASTIYSTYEEGIGGECETRYNIFTIPSLDDPDMSTDVYNITKVKNYRNCISRPKFELHNFETQGCPDVCRTSKPISHVPGYPASWNKKVSPVQTGCPYGFQPDFHPVKSYSLTKYNVSGASHQPIIEDIYNEGKTIYTINGDEFVVYVEQNFTLVEIEPLQASEPHMPSTETYKSLAWAVPLEEEQDHLELAFFSIFGPMHSEELIEVVMKKLEDVVEDIIPDDPQTSEYLGTKIIELFNALIVLKEEDLQTIYGNLENDKIEKQPRKQELMRKVFLDVMATATTNKIALFGIELIKANRVSSWEATEMIEGLGKNLMYPTEEVIEEMMKLLELPKVATKRVLFNSLAITIGKLVEQACVKPKLVRSFDVPHHVSQPTRGPQQVRPRFARGIAEHAPRSKYDREEIHHSQPAMPTGYRVPESQQCTPEKIRSYIQEIAKRLEGASDLNKQAIYIEALAHMSTPLVLPYLEPYLTGEAPGAEALEDEDTEFLRTVAIYSLHHIIGYYAEEVLPLVVPIYFDESEGYEVRIAAFTVLMNSKPGLVLLERIVSELWDENNNQVGSFVYSYLDDLANSTLPCDRALSQKVQLVFSQAPDLDLGIQYSNTYNYDFYDDEKDYGLSASMEWVASNVSVFPRSGYMSLSHIAGPFEDDILEVGYNAKGIDELLEKVTQPGGVLSQILSQIGSSVQTKNIHDVLELVKSKLSFNSRETETPRATVFYKLFGRTTYLTLDEQYVLRILEDVMNWFTQLDSTTGFSGQYVKVWMPSSFFKVIPSTIGFPVVINHRNPIVLSIILENARVAGSDHKESPLNSAFAVSSVIRPSVHISSVALAYAVSPAEDRLYGAAIEKVYEFSFPAVINVAVDLLKDTYALSIKPKVPHQVVYHRTRPTTFQAKAVLIDVPKTEWLDVANEIETMPEPLKYDERMETKTLGLGLRVSAESEEPWSNIPFYLSQTAYEDGVIPALLETLKNPGMKPREFHLYLEPHVKEPASEFVITVDYDRDISLHRPKESESGESNDSTEQDDLFEEYEDVLTSIYGKQYRIPDAEKTITDLIKKTKATWSPVLGHGSSDPVPATISHSWELTTVVKGAHSKHLAWKMIYAHTLDHRSIWVQIYGHKAASESYRERPWKFCGSMVAAFPQQPNPFYLEMNALGSQKAKLRADLGWGEDCSKDNEVVILGVMEKTEEQLTSSTNVYYDSPKGQSWNPWYFKQCEVHRSDGETQSYACQQAISDASSLNKLELEIVTRDMSPEWRNWTTSVDLALKSYWYPNMEVNPLVSNAEDTLRIVVESIEQVPDVPLTNLYIYKPTENVFFTRVYSPYYEPISTLDSMEEIVGDMLMNDDYNPECNLMEDYLNTFDNVTFELPDNKCQYVLAKDCSSEKSFAILVSQIDIEAKTKALAIDVAGHTIKMLPPRGDEVPVVIDGKDHIVSAQKPVVLDFNKEKEIYLYVKETVGPTDTAILVLEAADDDISIEYDGKNAKLNIPRKYKGDTCGLCGDFNDEEFWEFTGPSGCTWVDAEDFANSYAIPGQSCPVPPKPTGAAFCPEGVEIHHQHSRAFKPQRPRHEPEEGNRDWESKPRSWETKPTHHQQPRESHREVEERRKPVHPTIAHRGEDWEDVRSRPQSSSEDVDEDESRQIYKPAGSPRCIEQTTEYIEVGEEICFTTKPVYQCREGCRASRLRQVKYGFHCLPAEKPYVKNLKDQSRRGVVQQLLNKPIEHVETIQVPEKCL